MMGLFRQFPLTARAAYSTAALALILAGLYLAAHFADLPAAIPIFISLDGKVLDTAPKSFWTVQRLPAMGLLTLAIIAVMHVATLARGWTEHGRHIVSIGFSGLVFLLALKMVPNALSIAYADSASLRGPGLSLHYAATAAAIAGCGLILAALLMARGQQLVSLERRRQLPRMYLVALALLAAAYAAVTVITAA